MRGGELGNKKRAMRGQVPPRQKQKNGPPKVPNSAQAPPEYGRRHRTNQQPNTHNDSMDALIAHSDTTKDDPTDPRHSIQTKLMSIQERISQHQQDVSQDHSYPTSANKD